jgi:endonuclease/exonuclease/phosphatase family metal-dependent hydrolase
MAQHTGGGSCLQLRTIGGPQSTMIWHSPVVQSDRIALRAWCDAVGPAISFSPDEQISRKPGARILVVNWNVAVGKARIEELIRILSAEEVRKGYPEPSFVLLLEETFRRGADVPRQFPTRAKVPRRIDHSSNAQDIQQLARHLQWWMFYAPSMRNGRQDAEDRGNAILSSLPMEGFMAVELPFQYQRRVAVLATVLDAGKKLRVAAAHFDTRAPVLKGFFFGGSAARKRQALGLRAVLGSIREPSTPMIFAGDLNTVEGPTEASVGVLAEVLPRLACEGKRTHVLRLTLDHMFAYVPNDWEVQNCERGDDRLGSDHHPLVLPLLALSD